MTAFMAAGAMAAAACSDDPDEQPVGVVDLSQADTSADQPFVLSGVSNLTEVAQLTGPDGMNDTESVMVAGTDLGSMLTIDDTTYFLFGDTFGEREPDAWGGGGSIWRSNAIAYTTDDDPSDGITFDGWITDDVGWALEPVPGDKDGNGTGEVTKIPTHGFAIDDGTGHQTLYIAFMSVHFWGDPGAWDANYSGLAKSVDDGQTWEILDSPQWPGDSNFIQVAAQHVGEDQKDEDGEFIYFWSIPSGRFGGVQLMKVPANEESVEDLSEYRYFAGADDDNNPVWSDDMAAAETIVEGTIGELSVMHSDYLDRWIMTYSDAGDAVIREGLSPWGPWGDPIKMINVTDYEGLYSPYLDSRYVSNDGRTIYFTLSLWGPYNVFLFSVDLDQTPE
jgi:hypothetical protein